MVLFDSYELCVIFSYNIPNQSVGVALFNFLRILYLDLIEQFIPFFIVRTRRLDFIPYELNTFYCRSSFMIEWQSISRTNHESLQSSRRFRIADVYFCTFFKHQKFQTEKNLFKIG